MVVFISPSPPSLPRSLLQPHSLWVSGVGGCEASQKLRPTLPLSLFIFLFLALPPFFFLPPSLLPSSTPFLGTGRSRFLNGGGNCQSTCQRETMREGWFERKHRKPWCMDSNWPVPCLRVRASQMNSVVCGCGPPCFIPGDGGIYLTQTEHTQKHSHRMLVRTITRALIL